MFMTWGALARPKAREEEEGDGEDGRSEGVPGVGPRQLRVPARIPGLDEVRVDPREDGVDGGGAPRSDHRRGYEQNADDQHQPLDQARPGDGVKPP